MNLLFGVLVAAGATAATVAAMLLVRRRAPEGSRFADGDRASGVFGVLATGFSVLLGFIIFLAFQSYDEARSGAQDEAEHVTLQMQTAQYLAPDVAGELSGQLVCYARSVVAQEWVAMEAGTLGDAINPWSVAMFRTIRDVVPTSDVEQSAYDRWMEQSDERQLARQARVHGAEGLIPLPLWLVLFAVSAVIFVFMLFFADSAEGAVSQAVLMGSVTVVITLLLLLLAFFDHPHGEQVGKLRPTAMQRTLVLLDAQTAAVDLDVDVPCDRSGASL
jgi:amino acid transporter